MSVRDIGIERERQERDTHESIITLRRSTYREREGERKREKVRNRVRAVIRMTLSNISSSK